MGGWFSNPEPPRVFKEEAWRLLKGWDRSARDDLKFKIQSLCPDTSLHVQRLNIILMGEVGSGKSSFLNSINGVLKDDIVYKAEAGISAYSLTKEFMMYELVKGIPIRIGDTMGVRKDTSEADIRNILSVVDGHVPNGYMFTPQEEFTCDSPGYIPNPDIADKGHCGAIVINVNAWNLMTENMKSKIQSLAKGLWARKVPFFILLTHLDTYCPEVLNDVAKTFHIIALEILVDQVSLIVHGLPQNQIFPVINFKKDVILNYKNDILLLYALRAMVSAAQDYLEKKNLQYAQQEMGFKEFNKPLENEEMPMELYL